jgi:hypothetical protein
LVDLFVADHPVSIEQQKHWRPLQHVNAVNGKLVVKSWWKLHLVSDDDSLADPLVEEVESSQHEKDWHSHSVHHGDVNNVQHT